MALVIHVSPCRRNQAGACDGLRAGSSRVGVLPLQRRQHSVRRGLRMYRHRGQSITVQERGRAARTTATLHCNAGRTRWRHALRCAALRRGAAGADHHRGCAGCVVWANQCAEWTENILTCLACARMPTRMGGGLVQLRKARTARWGDRNPHLNILDI